MAEVVIKYKNTQKATMDASGTKTCATQGKYCEGNIVVQYNRPEVASDYTTEGDLSTELSGMNYTVYTPYSKGKHTSSLSKVVTPSSFGLESLAGIIKGENGNVYVPGMSWTADEVSTIVTRADLGITDKGAETLYPTTASQYIEAGFYLTGRQTFGRVITSNLTAGNIKKGVTIQVGNDNNSSEIASVTGTYEGEGSLATITVIGMYEQLHSAQGGTFRKLSSGNTITTKFAYNTNYNIYWYGHYLIFGITGGIPGDIGYAYHNSSGAPISYTLKQLEKLKDRQKDSVSTANYTKLYNNINNEVSSLGYTTILIVPIKMPSTSSRTLLTGTVYYLNASGSLTSYSLSNLNIYTQGTSFAD